MPLQAYKYIKFMLYSLFLEMKQNHIFAKLVLKTIIFKTKPLSKINGAKAKFKSVLRSLFANRKSSKFMALTKEYIYSRNSILVLQKFCGGQTPEATSILTQIIYQLNIATKTWQYYLKAK